MIFHLIGDVKIRNMLATDRMVHQEPMRLQDPVDGAVDAVESAVQVLFFQSHRMYYYNPQVVTGLAFTWCLAAWGFASVRISNEPGRCVPDMMPGSLPKE